MTPSCIPSLNNALTRKFGMTSLVSLGGFRNQRDCYSWGGHVLELDETDFEHGTLYEIECETVSRRYIVWVSLLTTSHGPRWEGLAS